MHPLSTLEPIFLFKINPTDLSILSSFLILPAPKATDALPIRSASKTLTYPDLSDIIGKIYFAFSV